ncbi:DUF167 domain-containing protein [Phytoactinopolyspora halotolerans]|uniref:DUF167 domain-containing protein n=1 Tax=Phytoactinopolyspora halotolerans TaxID=1981512 RepID=UPI0028A66A99|nr:DUF167 domain-containing protein [Phytoactinopolyspora halotolerans]
MTVRVKPGSKSPRVGGRYGDALVIAVRERAVDGKATRAAVAALADALGCTRRDVRLVAGETSRTKIMDVPESAAAALAGLFARDEAN